VGERVQWRRGFAEFFERLAGVVDQCFGPCAAGLDSQDYRIRGFSVFAVFAEAFTDRCFTSRNVEQIVHDLKRQTEVLAIGVQRCQLLVARAGDKGP